MGYVMRHGKRIEVETLNTGVTPRKRRSERHIGCPVEWLKHVLPIVGSKQELAIAIWLHRRRAVYGNELFAVPNRELYDELGLSRKVKYRALRRLAKAGVVAVVRDGKHALRVRIL